MTTNERALRMLSIALEMENKGKAFYDKAIQNCGNALGREIFTTLMQDEVVHVDRIKAIYTTLEGGKAWNDAWTHFHADHGEIKPLFRELAVRHGANIKAETSDLEALDVGIDFERKAVEFYEQQLPLTTDAQEKRFVEKMIGEEKSHYAVLSDMKAYLTDPAAWFAERERTGYDGA